MTALTTARHNRRRVACQRQILRSGLRFDNCTTPADGVRVERVGHGYAVIRRTPRGETLLGAFADEAAAERLARAYIGELTTKGD